MNTKFRNDQVTASTILKAAMLALPKGRPQVARYSYEVLRRLVPAVKQY
jgi:hypothetical protein